MNYADIIWKLVEKFLDEKEEKETSKTEHNEKD